MPPSGDDVTKLEAERLEDEVCRVSNAKLETCSSVATKVYEVERDMFAKCEPRVLADENPSSGKPKDHVVALGGKTRLERCCGTGCLSWAKVSREDRGMQLPTTVRCRDRCMSMRIVAL